MTSWLSWLLDLSRYPEHLTSLPSFPLDLRSVHKSVSFNNTAASLGLAVRVDSVAELPNDP